MQNYLVEWQINIDAETPEDAARQAFAIMQRSGTSATVFDIYPEDTKTGVPVRVDLTQMDQEGEE